ncbi:MAG: hypothetical protein ACKOPT_08595 [Cyanobium sp.]
MAFDSAKGAEHPADGLRERHATWATPLETCQWGAGPTKRAPTETGWTRFLSVATIKFIKQKTIMTTWTRLEEEAHEILDIGGVVNDPMDPVPTFKSGDSPETTGDTEIPDEIWADGYVPPPPYVRNTNRNLQFNEQIFIASPGYPDGVTSYVMTDDGYTWGRMSLAINAMWPYESADYIDSDIPLTRINAPDQKRAGISG